MNGTIVFSVYLLGCAFLGYYYARMEEALPSIAFVVFAAIFLLGVRFIAMQIGSRLDGRFPSDPADAETD